MSTLRVNNVTDLGDDAIVTDGVIPTYPGQILQVIESVANQGIVSTSSTSYVTTGHSLTITPASSNNKILISWGGYLDAFQESIELTIFRNGSNIVAGIGEEFLGNLNDVSGRQLGTSTFARLDSPATTSPVTYTVYFRAEAAAQVNIRSDIIPASLIAMEVAG